MTTRTLRVLAWCSVLLAACLAVLSLAPFTPAIIFAWPCWCSPPSASGVARRPALCVAGFAFIGSPLSLFDGWDRPIYACWMIVVVLLVIRWMRWS